MWARAEQKRLLSTCWSLRVSLLCSLMGSWLNSWMKFSEAANSWDLAVYTPRNNVFLNMFEVEPKKARNLLEEDEQRNEEERSHNWTLARASCSGWVLWPVHFYLTVHHCCYDLGRSIHRHKILETDCRLGNLCGRSSVVMVDGICIET